MTLRPEGETRSEWSGSRDEGLKTVSFSALAWEVLSSRVLGQWRKRGRGSRGCWALGRRKEPWVVRKASCKRQTTGSLDYAKDLDGKRHERMEGLEPSPKGLCLKLGKENTCSGRKQVVWSNQGG